MVFHKLQDLLGNAGLVADVTKGDLPVAHLRRVGVLGRYNANGDFRRLGEVGAIERDGRNRPPAHTALCLLVQAFEKSLVSKSHTSTLAQPARPSTLASCGARIQGAACALAPVQSPATHALQHGGAVDPLSEALQFGVVGHGAVPLASIRMARAPSSSVRRVLILSRPGNREAGGLQGRRPARRPRSGFPRGPPGASGSASPSLLLSPAHACKIAAMSANSGLVGRCRSAPLHSVFTRSSGLTLFR
jgi:hypothetical protein